MAAPSLDQFGKALVASGLLTADELKALWNAIPADARPKQGDGFAKLLVQQGKLNQFQADELLSGRNTPLLMGDYVLVAELGAGGMGKVYKARHRRMERIVALKVMSTAAMQDEAAVKRFQREVKAAARLEHPNIVTAYDSGEIGKVKYLVMQFVDGGDLSQLVKQSGPLEIERAVDYVLQAARGLGFAHGEGVVHRDIKPANLLLDKKGVVKILDMGLARIEGGDGLTATEQVMGTVDYMSPEQAANTKTADGRSDIYSLGCTLWFLLTAKKVYDGDTMISRLMSHRTDPLPSLVKTRDDVPWSLEQAFHKMIAKSPEDRFQSMDEVVAALEPFAPSGGSRSGMGSSIGMGPQSAEMASFLKSIGPAVKPQTKPAPTGTKVDVEATARFAAAGADTDPKSQLLPPPQKAAQPQAKGSGKKPPPNKNLLLAAAGGGALLVLLGVWFIFRDKEGNEVARVKVPDGGSVAVQQQPQSPTTPASPSPVPTARPASTVSFFGGPVTSFGTPVVAVPPPPPGDYAMRFFKGGARCELPNPGVDTTQPFTVEAYVIPDEVPSGYLSSNQFISVSGEFHLELTDNCWSFYTTHSHIRLAESLVPRRRVHLAGVRTADRRLLFVDGKLAASNDERLRRERSLNSHPLIIQSPGLDFTIDEVRITQGAIYDKPFSPEAKLSPRIDTLALYHFDEGFGDVLKDSSSKKRDGPITNALWVKADGSPIPPTSPPAPLPPAPLPQAIAPAVPSSNGVVYLDDLAETEAKVAFQSLGKHGKFVDKDNGDQTVLWRGGPVAHSLFMHPGTGQTSFARYQIDGRYATFAADAGISESADAVSPVIFRVLGDGRELWKSQPLQKRDESAAVSVDIRGVKELRLETSCQGSSRGSHATWFMPRLTPVAASSASPQTIPPAVPAPRWPLAPSKLEDIVWLHGLNATLTLRGPSAFSDDPSDVIVKPKDALPTKPATIVGIDFGRDNAALMTDDVLKRTATFVDLESLSLGFASVATAVTKDGLPQLVTLVNLRRLNLGRIGSKETDPAFLERFVNLESLHLGSLAFLDWEPHVARLPVLAELRIDKMGGANLQRLGPLPRLTALGISDYGDAEGSKRHEAAKQFAPLVPWCRITVFGQGNADERVVIEPTVPPPAAASGTK